MNTTIPGAEYAPTINLGIRPSTMGDWEQVERRLSCSDPDDMRAIWRRAALALGATEEEALTARIWFDGLSWHLITSNDRFDHGHSYPPMTTGMFSSGLHALTREEATAALCRAVWGPK